MATALTIPTAAQILALMPIDTGNPTIVKMGETAIQKEIDKGETGMVSVIYYRMVDILTTGGYTTTALPNRADDSSAVYGNAYQALLWATVFELLQLDWFVVACIPDAEGNGVQSDEYKRKWIGYRDRCAGFLTVLSISGTVYHAHEVTMDDVFEVVDNCNDSDYYSNNNIGYYG